MPTEVLWKSEPFFCIGVLVASIALLHFFTSLRIWENIPMAFALNWALSVLLRILLFLARDNTALEEFIDPDE